MATAAKAAHRLAARPLAMLLVALAWAGPLAEGARLMQQSGQPGCAEGCALSADERPVCSSSPAGSVTLQASCLAECQGLRVLHEGPCEADGDMLPAMFAAAPAEAAASSEGQGAAGAPTAAVSAGAMARFAAEGFVCVGVAAVDASFVPTKKRLGEEEDGDNGAPSPAEARRASDLRIVRVSARDGLMYVGAVAPAAAAAAAEFAAARGGGGSSVSSAASICRKGLAELVGHEDAPASGGGGTGGPPAPGATPAAAAAAAGRAWPDAPQAEILTRPHYPFSAVGRLRTARGGWCTAAQIGTFTVLTAAHCVFDRENQRAADPATMSFEPATYRNSSGQRVLPFGSQNVAYTSYLQGWAATKSDAHAWAFDVAAVTLEDQRRTGTLGLSCSRGGFAGTIRWAGYPGLTAPHGYLRRSSCSLKEDKQGEDSRLKLLPAKKWDRCDVLEPGESGAPFFLSQPSAAGSGGRTRHFIRAVESHSVKCNGYEVDIATELSPDNYAFAAISSLNRP